MSAPPQTTQQQNSVERVDVLFDRVLLVASLSVLVAAMLLDVQSNVQVVIPGIGRPLPEICTVRRLFGVDCPGCGLTRSFISLAHGQWLTGWQYHPAGPWLFGIVALQIPLRAVRLWQAHRGLQPLRAVWVVPLLWCAFAIMLVHSLTRVLF